MTVLGRTLNVTASKPRIGFIGLGAMGRGMARNLAAKGFPLTVVGNRNRAPVDDLTSRGASEAKAPAEQRRLITGSDRTT